MGKIYHHLVSFVGYRIVSPVIYIVYRYILGWKIEGNLPDVPKMIAALAPHTASIDFLSVPILLVYFNVRPHWIAKKEMFKPPFGPFYYDLGGISVDREAPLQATKRIMKFIKQEEKVILCLAPEGTRYHTDHWKKGFYFIAHKTKIPIVFVKLNYAKRKITLRQAFYTTGDADADMAIIRPFYDDAVGYHPDRASEIRLVESEM